MAAVVAGVWLLGQTKEAPLHRILQAAIALALCSGVFAAALRLEWAPIRSRASTWHRVAAVLAVLACASTVATAAWIGANSPSKQWFGHVISHGPRDRPEVALTFDDGPNVTATLQITAILDAHGVKGTFFEVGKAVNRDPTIPRALVADGHLVANHSYSHDYVHWLDPLYRELGETERTFRRTVSVCPAFFRPPHGQHTPFMAAVVHHNDMVMVTWDVSVGDWALTNPAVIAERVLSKVRPGSIIDLHDGLDGDLTTNRSTLVRAIPLILDGLARKGLRPVRLDKLLERPGYRPGC